MSLKTILLTGFVVFATTMQAQVAGSIQYDEKVNVHRSLPPGREQFKDMIPEFRTVATVLHFSQSATRYEQSERETQDEINEMSQGRGRRFRMRMGSPSGKVFTNLEDKKVIEQRDFMDKKFIIDGEQKSYNWKITGEQKKIHDLIAMKAVTNTPMREEDSTEVELVVWFTMQIPVSGGPGNLGGLPGLILEADYDDGLRSITAHSISMDAPEAELMVPPTKGKKVTKEEFREIVQVKMKEMREQFGGRRPGGRRP